jgi:exopolyphosphatase/guanosine-5'-triphosphate,3'-diphosphate pyrophosphatase
MVAQPTKAEATRSDSFAAVDLGSNSFHMKIVRVVQDEIQDVDRLRERVRLAGGLQKDKTLSDDALARALETLARFGERLRHIPAKQVRAVGTNTLRQVKNQKAILRKAAEALGHPIEVISGPEEARLIYLGVSHSLPFEDERRLVVDIGGGSTECIIGEGFESHRAASLFMGCVSYTLNHFPDGELSERNMRAAETAARVELETIEDRFRSLGWERAYGSSGTILAVDLVLRENGWGPGITRKGLKKLERAIVDCGRLSKLALPGLSEERAPVFPGGVAILRSVFDALGVEVMEPSTGALREGVLFDLIGRIRHEDSRERAIQRLVEQYRVDTVQAGRVERAALSTWKQLKTDWALEEHEHRQLLAWAARLHEIGLTISYSGYQRHGAYIIANSELSGFSLDEQRFLAALIEAHRRKIPRDRFSELTLADEETALRLAIILRLAVLLNRSRSPSLLPRIQITGRKKGLGLSFPSGWLAEHPLTQADLQEEAATLRKAGYELEI